MSWGESPSNRSGWWVVSLMALVGLSLFALISVVNGFKERELKPYSQHIFYCPECLTLFGKQDHKFDDYYFGWRATTDLRGVCPECGDNLKPTPYKTWDEVNKGSWRPRR